MYASLSSHGGAARTFTLVALAALLHGATPRFEIHAQQVSSTGVLDPGLFRAWKWRNIGPNRGGRSIAVAGSSSRPLEYYFGATGGGVWRTTNGGTDWMPMSDGYFTSASVGSIEVCPANPDVVYVGTGEGDFRTQFSTGDGAYKTTDGGETWTHIGLDSGTGQQVVARMRVHPTNCDIVYAAVLGDPYGPTAIRGVFRSRDGGRTWQKILYRSEQAGASDLALDPSDPLTIYATIWDVQRKPWGGYTGQQSGIFKSTDGGDNWVELTRNPGLPRERIGKAGISVSGADRSRVYAIIEAEASGGVFRSDDGGATWQQMSDRFDLINRSEYYIRIYADPRPRDRVYVLNEPFFRSDDGGRTYTVIRTPHGDNHDLWIDPANPQRMINANDGGANVTVDGGLTWTAQDYPTPQLYHVAITGHFPYHVCGSQQDNSTACMPMDGDGSYFYHVAGGEAGYIAPDPRVSDVFYAGSYQGFLTRYDRRTGQARNIEVWPEFLIGHEAARARERFQWTYPILISPQDPNVVYVGSQHVWRTLNGGQTWERLSPDLTRADPQTVTRAGLIMQDHNSQDYYATIFTIALSPHDSNVIWAGSDDGLIHVTRDGGRNWEDVTPGELPQWTRASLLAVSPHAPGKAYLAAERYKAQDVAPYVFKTEDYGKTWTKIVGGIPNGHFVRAVREDPVRPGLLFAGTERGVWVSFDDGGSWQSLSLNLPVTQVADLMVKGNDLVIVTFGRGAWVLGDISPLRELGSELLADAFHLFKPGDAVRSLAERTDFYRQAAIPGLNRARIYYHLRQPARQVTLEILDAQGRAIRTFLGGPGSEVRVPVRDPLGQVVNGPGAGWPEFPPTVETGAGLHSIEWDLRYPPASTLDGLFLWSPVDGPVALPGPYSVRLSVDGQSQTASFRILKDPRVGDVTEAELRAQFELGMQVRDRLDQTTGTAAAIRELRAAIDSRMREANERTVSSRGETLKARLREVEEALYMVDAQSTQHAVHLGVRLASQLAGLLNRVVESADAPPTDQTQAVFQELSKRLDGEIAKLRQVLTTELPPLNDALRALGLAPIEAPARLVVIVE